jgi:predicted metal-dependent phosphoesterase TrpH
MPRYDLHCHSTCSDGVLSPSALVSRAVHRGVDVLALTDHDETAGLAAAGAEAKAGGLTFIPGAELSVTWEDATLHVLALGIDPDNPTLQDGLNAVRRGRAGRARRIAASLAEAGIGGAFEGASNFVTSERLISRTHFARFLVDAGYAKQVKDVFKRYLSPGKPGYVAHRWATLPQAVDWTHCAGGQAVLAHPGRYKLDAEAMRRLLRDFRDAGGDAIEIVSPSHTRAQCHQFAALARVFGLRASGGSDFHSPAEGASDLGDVAALPSDLVPVWKDW